jgi:amino acid transporter
VDYGCSQFMNALFSLYGVNIGFADWSDGAHIMSETFLLFAAILTIHALINIFSSPLVALFNNISVFWHVAGVAAIVLILAFVPDTHQSVDFVFTERINNSGFGEGMFWFYVLPLGFLLTMYTQTGYDASAHISEETHGASTAAAKGVWRSVFWSGVGGWIVLLAITFAATDVKGINEGFGSSLAVFSTALSPGWDKMVVLIATSGSCSAAWRA